MAYQRKTHDVYLVEEYTPSYGWEYSGEFDTKREALLIKRDYIKNGYDARVRKVRVKNGEEYNR